MSKAERKVARAQAEARQMKWVVGEGLKPEPAKMLQEVCGGLAFWFWERERGMGPMLESDRLTQTKGLL